VTEFTEDDQRLYDELNRIDSDLRSHPHRGSMAWSGDRDSLVAEAIRRSGSGYEGALRFFNDRASLSNQHIVGLAPIVHAPQILLALAAPGSLGVYWTLLLHALIGGTIDRLIHTIHVRAFRLGPGTNRGESDPEALEEAWSMVRVALAAYQEVWRTAPGGYNKIGSPAVTEMKAWSRRHKVELMPGLSGYTFWSRVSAPKGLYGFKNLLPSEWKQPTLENVARLVCAVRSVWQMLPGQPSPTETDNPFGVLFP
jgi:hypothetical protein